MTSYAQHYRSTLKLGVPLCIGQIGVILVGFADTLMVGHYGTNDLASVSFVNNLFNLVIIGLLGFSYGITPIIGALFARQKYDEAGAAFRNALIANALFGILLTVVMGCAYFFIDRFGQPDELLPIIRPYYLVILASIVFVALFNAMRQFADSLLRPSVGMWILISGNAVNIVFNYLLIYGKCGMPELGALGAGISTLGSRVLMTVVFAVVLLRGQAYAPMRKAFLHTRESVGEMLSITRTSMPISLQMAMETGTFTFGGVMMGWLGTVELASYQVILTISTLGFMFYYSIGAAVAIRVSNYVGRGNQAEVRRSTWAGYHILLAMVVAVSFLLYFAKEPLVGIFTDDSIVAASAMALILPLIIYQCGDATQICFANALRGTGQSMSMMWIAFVSYILVGIPSGWLLGFPLGLRDVGIFYAFSVALFVGGALFLWQFLRATRKHQCH